MKRGGLFALAVAAAVAASAHAGPPFITDDPEPTDAGHWEIYAPFADSSGRGRGFGGSTGAEINYGAGRNLQLTLGLPEAYVHDGAGWHAARGDMELSVKYRLFHSEATDVSIAVFPGITLPTASKGFGNRTVTALLPIWAQKGIGSWAVFGGGGYAINPGPANRDYWTGGAAITETISKQLLIGVEADREGADTIRGHASTSLGVGAILSLAGPFRLLASAGPTFTHREGAAGYHGFIALGLDL